MKGALLLTAFVLLAGGAMLTVWNVATFLTRYSRPPSKHWRLINTILGLTTLLPPLCIVAGWAHPVVRNALFVVFPAAALAQATYLRSQRQRPRGPAG